MSSSPNDPQETKILSSASSADAALSDHLELGRVSLEVVEGNDKGSVFRSENERCALGSSPGNDVILRDETVSRFHCELVSTPSGVRVRDLGSTNGTFVDGVRVFDALLREQCRLQLGGITLRVSIDQGGMQVPLSRESSCGELVGESDLMRGVFDLLVRCAKTESTVLIEGETGTGKEGAAHAIHTHSPRAQGPFVVVDCGSIPMNLIESELFGHEKGSFTGAVQRHLGAFEQAEGGTIFLDEIGELPTDLQPKLLRVLEQKTIRRVGGSDRRSVDLRIVAATNRDLRQEVNEGRFRSDLYYRLSVVKVVLPPLRARPTDLPVLARSLLERIGARPEQVSRFTSLDFVERLRRGAWPGNVRELRNYLERCLVMDEEVPLTEPEASEAPAVAGHAQVVDLSLSYTEARQRALVGFEQAYLTALLAKHGGNVSQAAREAGIDRVYLHRLLRRRSMRGAGS